MKPIPTLLATAAAVTLASCGPRVHLVGSGNIVTETPEIDGFTEVRASSAFDVKVSYGAEFRVEIRTDDNVLPHLKIEKSGDALRLGFKRGVYSTKNVTLEAEVTMPTLNKVKLSGASRAMLSGFDSTEAFEASLSGASSITGELRCSDAEFNLSGASKANLTGGCTTIEVSASGASSLMLFDFSATDADVSASGASRVSVNASGRIDASASGASQVTHSGNPTLGDISISGGSSVKAE